MVIEQLRAIERADDGSRTVCIDEMRGIQAIERKEKDLPLRPGKVKRREARVYPSWNTGVKGATRKSGMSENRRSPIRMRVGDSSRKSYANIPVPSSLAT